MKKLLTQLGAVAVLLFVVASNSFAQTTTPAATYTGPRYPGGPDSLRALVARSTRLAAPVPTGRILLQFELQADGKPQNFQVVPPPRPVSPELLQAAAVALRYLEARMLAWQPGSPDSVADRKEIPKISVVLDFTPSAATAAYAYADQVPVFSDLAALLRAKNIKDFSVEKASLPQSLIAYTQMQARYPSTALRNGEQGQVHVYFEVAESGTVEHHEILGTAGRALDAEVFRAIKTLPAATAPAQLQGRPVRMYYVLPITFKIR